MVFSYLGMDDDVRGCCTSRLDATTGAWYWRRGRLVAVVAVCSVACILGDVMLASVTPHTIKQAKRTLSGFDTLTSVTTRVEIKFYGAFVALCSTPSTRCLLDGVAMPVPHRSTEPARPRRLREMTSCTRHTG